MSIPVDLAALAETLEGFGTGYLLTSAQDQVKAVSVTARVEDGVVVIPTSSRRSAANLAASPVATLLFPPLRERGYSLLVDGTAEAVEEGFRFVPMHAILHRPAADADEPIVVPEGACGNDCKHL